MSTARLTAEAGFEASDLPGLKKGSHPGNGVGRRAGIGALPRIKRE